MPDPADDRGTFGVAALKAKLAAIRAKQPEVEPEMFTEVVRAVLTTISDDLTAKEAKLLREVEDLGPSLTAEMYQSASDALNC
jgi:chemotaxis protein CheZ